MAKRTRQQELYPDLLELIVKKLSFPDAVRFSAVCSSWLTAAKTSNVFSRPIFLTIPGSQTVPNAPLSLRLFSLAERKLSCDSNDVVVSLKDSHCIGSSKERLVLLDERSPNDSAIVLINPISGESFRVSSVGLSAERGFKRLKTAVAGRVEISKAVVLVLSERKNKAEPNLVLVVIYGFGRQRIAYCGAGGAGGSWTVLEGEHRRYEDIVCRGRRLYALSESGSIESWEFDESGFFPAKAASFVPCEVLPSVAIGHYQNDMYFERRYLVESMGELLLVRRFVGYYVDENGDLLNEGDLLTDEDPHPLVCPYRTIEFHVYKACLGSGEKWEKVESLGGHRALFLGGNESVSVSPLEFAGCEGNSIYFTDDNWDGMTADYLYGGHDMGVYSLEDKAVKSFYELDDEKVDPPPFWIVPNPVKPS